MRMFVVGFMFDSRDRDRVLLIVKKRPDWQVGKLNGLGGKVENGESAVQCMVREFREESGLNTTVEDWQHVAVISGTAAHDRPAGPAGLGILEPWTVHFFRSEGPIHLARTQTDEELLTVSMLWLKNMDVVDALRWLIPLCQPKVFPFIKPIVAMER